MKTVIEVKIITFDFKTKTVNVFLGGGKFLSISDIFSIANEKIDEFFLGEPPIWAVSKMSKMVKDISIVIHNFVYDMHSNNLEVYKFMTESRRWYKEVIIKGTE